jgi:hypothetical protein
MEICFFHFCRFHLQLTVCGREEIEKNVGADVELDVYRSDDQLQVARERHMAGLPKQEVFTWDRAGGTRSMDDLSSYFPPSGKWELPGDPPSTEPANYRS